MVSAVSADGSRCLRVDQVSANEYAHGSYSAIRTMGCWKSLQEYLDAVGRPCLGKNGRCNGRFINNRFGTGTVANRCAHQPRRVGLGDSFE